jgi:hypothetical protein
VTGLDPNMGAIWGGAIESRGKTSTVSQLQGTQPASRFLYEKRSIEEQPLLVNLRKARLHNVIELETKLAKDNKINQTIKI